LGIEINAMKSPGGFSIVELMVAVLLLAVLAGVAIPSLIALNGQLQLSSAANQVSGDLQLSRMKAIAKRKKFRVTFDTATETYQVEENTGCTSSSYSAAAPARSLPTGINITSVTANPVFQCSGTASGATINLANANGQTKSVIVNLVGRVRIQ
jgi:prepilin-type N-terminal cleavage/methylation domain-containing protein